MVKSLPDLLELTAETVHLWRKSGFPKAFWKIFRWMSSWHHRWRRNFPGQILHRDQSRQMDADPLMVALMSLFCRETNSDLMNMSIIRWTTMFTNHRRISMPIHSITITLLWREIHILQCLSSPLMHFATLLLSHPFRCGWLRRRTNLFCRFRSSDNWNVWWISWRPDKVPVGMQANHAGMSASFHTSLMLLDIIQWWNWLTKLIIIIFFTLKHMNL